MDTPKSRLIKVLVAIGYKPLRLILCRLLDHHSDIEVVGCPSNGDEAIRMAIERRPEVVVMGGAVPGLSGAEATRRLLRAVPGVRIVGYAEQEYYAALSAAGAAEVVVRSMHPSRLLEAIRKAAERV